MKNGIVDFFDYIEDEIEDYEGDDYQSYNDYMAGVVDYYDFLDGEEIVFNNGGTFNIILDGLLIKKAKPFLIDLKK